MCQCDAEYSTMDFKAPNYIVSLFPVEWDTKPLFQTSGRCTLNDVKYPCMGWGDPVLQSGKVVRVMPSPTYGTSTAKYTAVVG